LALHSSVRGHGTFDRTDLDKSVAVRIVHVQISRYTQVRCARCWLKVETGSFCCVCKYTLEHIGAYASLMLGTQDELPSSGESALEDRMGGIRLER